MNCIRVALVEDHDLIRFSIRKALLRCSDIELVGEAATAKDGLKLLLSSKPDVAIVDVDIPGYNGIELTRKFRQAQTSDSTSDTKVLILTLRSDSETIADAFSAGVSSYCLKHISLDDLIKALRSTYAGSPWIDPQIAPIWQQQASRN